jgi:hypothetical protein
MLDLVLVEQEVSSFKEATIWRNVRPILLIGEDARPLLKIPTIGAEGSYAMLLIMKAQPDAHAFVTGTAYRESVMRYILRSKVMHEGTPGFLSPLAFPFLFG